MTGFVSRNIADIQGSRWLRHFGVALSFTHVLTFAFWLSDGKYLEILRSPEPVCWPFLTNCEGSLRPFLGQTFLWIYLVLGITGVALFLSKGPRRTGWAWWTLAALTAMKSLALLQDYRLMGNYNYMQLLVSLAFLLLPAKEDLVPKLIVGFYFWAGTLKLNTEWLSGVVFYNPVTTGWPLYALCTYAVFLELFLSFALVSRRGRIFVPVMIQFVLFHGFSWWEVGFFYPCLMFCLDSALVMRFIFDPDKGSERTVFERWRETAPATAWVLAVFSVAQLIPRIHPGDPALTGQGRLFALSMLDARTECESVIVARSGDRRSEIPFSIPFLQPRIHCDPAVYFGFAKNLCRKGRAIDPSYSVSMVLRSMRSTDSDPRTVISESDFCREDLRLSVFRANPWIRVDQPNPATLSSPQITRFELPPLKQASAWRFEAAGEALVGDPVIGGEQVFFSNAAGTLYDLRRSDGETHWVMKLPGSHLTPLWYVEADDALYVRLESPIGAGAIARLEARSGRILWTSESYLGVSDGQVIVGDRTGRLYRGETRLAGVDSRMNGSEVVGLDPDSGADRRHIFISGRILWPGIRVGDAAIFAVAGSEGTMLESVRVDAGGTLWKVPLKGSPPTRILPGSDGRTVVLVFEDGQVAAFDSRDGKRRLKGAMPGEKISLPTFKDGILKIVSVAVP